MPHEQSSPERSAGIASRGLNPDVLEGTFARQAPVGDAVQSDAAGKHEVALVCPPLRFARHLQDDLFGYDLDARGGIHMPLFEGRFRLARRAPEQPMKTLARHRQPLTIIEILH